MTSLSESQAHVDRTIKAAVDTYLKARHELLVLSADFPQRIGGNDNIIGRIGEFMALLALEADGQSPKKHKSSSNPGFDLEDLKTGVTTQVKVITEENKKGRTMRLRSPWDQFVLVELADRYRCSRIGLLTKEQHEQALNDGRPRSKSPIASRTMLQPGGLIGRYGRTLPIPKLFQ